MTLAAAIRTGDVSLLPGRRDEDWRWTDLRGLLRTLPPLSRPFTGEVGPGPFEGLGGEPRILRNGGEIEITAPAGGKHVVPLRILSRGLGRHNAKVRITVGRGATLQLLESYESDTGSVSQTMLTFDLAEDAVVERIVLACDNADAVTVSQAEVKMAPGASFSQTLLTSGARRQRLETHLAHPGGHATVQLDGVYLLSDKRHADLTTVVAHEAVDGATGQLTKGVVRDQARAVFQGRIVVAQGADRTEARMAHHALILSDRAEVDAKPELEIYADDVVCAHGNTVGALDEDALFYARQRGMPEAVARAMLMDAFLGEVVERIAFEPARDVARAWVAQWLEGQP